MQGGGQGDGDGRGAGAGETRGKFGELCGGGLQLARSACGT